MNPIIVTIGALEDKDLISSFNTHTHPWRPSPYNGQKGYTFKDLSLGNEAGLDTANEAELALNQCILVVLFLSVDVMVDDQLYALVNQAITVAKQRNIKVVGIQMRADLGCERDLWKRINGVLVHKQKPISEHTGHHSDSAWVEITGMLRRYLPATK